MPSHPHAEIADQIKSRCAQHICRDKPAQADPLTQEPSCKGNRSKGRDLEDHFPAEMQVVNEISKDKVTDRQKQCWAPD